MVRGRVLIADERTLFREDICALLKICEDVEIVEEATKRQESVEGRREQMPDVVLNEYSYAHYGWGRGYSLDPQGGDKK